MRYLNDYDITSKYTLTAMDASGIIIFVGYFTSKESAKIAFDFCSKVDKAVSYGKIRGQKSLDTL